VCCKQLKFFGSPGFIVSVNAKNAKFALCVDNTGYSASLDRMRVYRLLPPLKKSLPGFLRVMDESGEDYLYPESLFYQLEIPATEVKRLVGPVSAKTQRTAVSVSKQNRP
jgi:hypothetical protein